MRSDPLPRAALALAALVALTAPRAGAAEAALLFREDWRETPESLPITPEHVAHPDLTLSLHGPGGPAGVKKSHHANVENDPFYVWSGMCAGNWAVSLRPEQAFADLSGPGAKIRWRAKQSGFRQLRIILRLADGAWLVGDAVQGASSDWKEAEFIVADIRWRQLDIEKVVEGREVENPDLSRVDAVGFTDLMTGGGSPASSRLDWIEAWGQSAPR